MLLLLSVFFNKMEAEPLKSLTLRKKYPPQTISGILSENVLKLPEQNRK
jgi:hypothetical protein